MNFAIKLTGFSLMLLAMRLQAQDGSITNPFPSDGSAEPSGGYAEDSRYWDMHSKTGQFTITYDFYSIPDTMDVLYDGQTIYQTGLINGDGSITLPFGPGNTKLIQVIMNLGDNTDTGTAWEYTLKGKSDEDFQLFDEYDNSEILDGGTAWIRNDPDTGDPMMPQLDAKATTLLNGSIQWKLTITDSRIRAKSGSYTYTVKDPQTKKKTAVTSNYYYLIAPMTYTIPPFTAMLDSQVDWEVDFGTQNFLGKSYDAFYGGNATMSAVFPSGKTPTRNFKILGENPESGDVIDYVNTVNPALWYAPAIFDQESSLEQFFDSDTSKLYRDKPGAKYDLRLMFKQGEPLFGAPAGYGIGQFDAVANKIDKLNPEILWNWQANVDQSLILMQAKHDEAVAYFAAVAAQAKSRYVAPPTFPDTDLSAVDAMAICLYNGIKGTLKVKVPGYKKSRAPYKFDINHQTWSTSDNINDYIDSTYTHIQSLGLSPN